MTGKVMNSGYGFIGHLGAMNFGSKSLGFRVFSRILILFGLIFLDI